MFDAKIGDEVGYYRSHNWHGTILGHGFGRVVKINHHGHITLDNGRQFDRHGDERKVEYGGLRLIVADELHKQLALREQQRARNRAAQELIALVNGQRNGYGEQCAVGEETRARMIELVNQL
jgi:hypothetical protein